MIHKIDVSSLQHCIGPVSHWLSLDPPSGGLSVRGTAVAIAKSGRTKNKKVKTVVTRANIFVEAFKYFRSLVELFAGE